MNRSVRIIIARATMAAVLAIGALSPPSHSVAAESSHSALNLQIGDPAPKLEVMKWLKGLPVNTFDKGHVYVIEFWATWCGPCRAAMPHLSELAKQYASQLTIIGIDVREAEQGYSTGDIGFVQKFVDRQGEKMGYTVAMDDPAKKNVVHAWMDSMGLLGIPASAIVDQQGRIAWVGISTDAEKFSRRVAEVVNGTNDLKAARTQQEAERRQTAARLHDREVLDPLHELIKLKEYRRTLEDADSLIAERPEYRYRFELFQIRLQAFLHLDESRGLSYARARLLEQKFLKELHEGNGRYSAFVDTHAMLLGAVGVTIAGEDGLSTRAYEFAVTSLQDALAQHTSISEARAALAQAYHRVGDIGHAVAAQEEAIRYMESLNSQGGMENKIVTLKETLASFKTEQAKIVVEPRPKTG